MNDPPIASTSVLEPSLVASGEAGPAASSTTTSTSTHPLTDYLDASTARPAARPSSTASSATSIASHSPVPTIFGVVLVDFDHLIGPTIEYSTPSTLREDEELARILPFLALPDGAHAVRPPRLALCVDVEREMDAQRDEDYSYFHILAPSISTSTIFGISCNRQLASSALLNKPTLVTRSTVQKAIVVLASQPIFGPLRDKLGVITRAFFAQKDFEQVEILEDFRASLEQGVGDTVWSTESAMYMGTSGAAFFLVRLHMWLPRHIDTRACLQISAQDGASSHVPSLLNV